MILLRERTESLGGVQQRVVLLLAGMMISEKEKPWQVMSDGRFSWKHHEFKLQLKYISLRNEDYGARMPRGCKNKLPA